MIRVDISEIWSRVSLPDLLGIESEVSAAHAALMAAEEEENNPSGWLALPEEDETLLKRILRAAEKIRSESDVCVVVGIGASALGARAAIELLQGPNHNMGKGMGNPRILFAGNTISTRSWNELVYMLEGQDVSLIVVSKSGTTLEPLVALRELKWMMERRYGTDGAHDRIYAVTDSREGTLCRMALEEAWECFAIPENVSGRFSALTAAGLLPMAVAGIDIRALLEGAREAKAAYDLRSFENPVWLYAAVRNLLYRNGVTVELLESFEPGFRAMGSWCQQLFITAEGKEGKGLFPAVAELPGDLHTLGQWLRDGAGSAFETVLRFAPPRAKMTLMWDARNVDGLNDLAGKTLDELEELAFAAAVTAHTDGGTPILRMDCDELNAKTLGELFWFFQLSCGISAGILGVAPYSIPGVAGYRENLSRLLGLTAPEDR